MLREWAEAGQSQSGGVVVHGIGHRSSTIARVFVDTNVLVYARDASEPAKQARASAWLRRVAGAREGRLSYQVLNEYYETVTRKPSVDLG